ncbi:electron transport complex subunit RsxB [Noviherbaspirillum album]|uniref:electron transport complex subunit RsxB n=1 Tax=Noviherbaspirillum album TaxID=3080276 RepID=UPI003F58AF46
MSFPPSLADQLEDLLPQTQCTKCGYPACRPYAEAMATGDAAHNQCPPGGMDGVARLASLLGKPIIPLNPANGIERPRPVAVIDETLCIGCTLCIQACPVDAIVGAAKQMHTVVPALCTGCDLCVAPCPVDCIAMVDVTSGRTGWAAWSREQADAARARHEFRTSRLRREKEENDARLAAKAAAKLKAVESEPALSPEERAAQDRKKAIIQAAMERARLQKEKMAAMATATGAASRPTGLDDVSAGVRKQIADVNHKMETQARAKDKQ